MGELWSSCFSKTAPKNVNSFVFLAKNGYYENITWHRGHRWFHGAIRRSDGERAGGSPGYQVPLETVPGLLYDREGRVGAARNRRSRQCRQPSFSSPSDRLPTLTRHLQPQAIPFSGRVVEGLNVLRQITIRNVDQNPNLPKGDPLVSVRIVDVDAAK